MTSPPSYPFFAGVSARFFFFFFFFHLQTDARKKLQEREAAMSIAAICRTSSPRARYPVAFSVTSHDVVNFTGTP